MIGAARTAQISGWRPSGPANARRVGTTSTNSGTTWTAVNGATTSTTQYKYGTASMYSNANNSHIRLASATFMDYGTGDFCIEWWMWIPSLSSHSTSCDLFAADVTGGLGLRLASAYNTNGLSSANPKYVNIFARNQADLDNWDMTTGTSGSNWAAETWYFCVLQRKGTTVSFWRDGVLKTRAGSGGGTRNFASVSTNNIRVGAADTTTQGAGTIYIDEMCWSNTYRYSDTTLDIPVPTAAFTVDSYTSQLMHMDGSDGGTTFSNDQG